MICCNTPMMFMERKEPWGSKSSWFTAETSIYTRRNEISAATVGFSVLLPIWDIVRDSILLSSAAVRFDEHLPHEDIVSWWWGCPSRYKCMRNSQSGLNSSFPVHDLSSQVKQLIQIFFVVNGWYRFLCSFIWPLVLLLSDTCDNGWQNSVVISGHISLSLKL